MSRWATVVVALLLASAVSTSTLAMCMAELAAGAEAQMACCKAGHDKCPMHAAHATSAKDCCKTDGQRQQQLSAAEHEILRPLTAPLAPVFAISVDALAPASVCHASVSPRVSQVTLPSTPPHFLAAVLLI
jgi:hypothetical protein